MQEAVPFEPADHIIDNIWLGPQHAGKDLEYFKQEKIGYVLLAGDNLVSRFKDQGIEYLEIDIADEPKEDAAQHF